MSVSAIEATIENGQIRLPPSVHLPEHTKVHVVVPEAVISSAFHVHSPRLANPEQAIDFRKAVVPELA